MQVRIDVTEEDIRQGQPGSRYHCPIAKALNRAFADRLCVFAVTPSRLLVLGIDLTLLGKCWLPRPAIDFISGFDQELSVRPFSAVFDLPDTMPCAERCENA